MRIFNLCFLLFLAALQLGTKTQLCAQSFQQPTAEELSMTADAKAPGADAVYLYREETADDNLHFHGIYVRLKVLTEKGKEAATVNIPYQKGEARVAGLKGRTIHADGTVIPMTVKPADLMEYKRGEREVNQIVFSLPDVEVGSILEYKLDIQFTDNIVYAPKWDIQQDYFVHKAHYLFKPDRARNRFAVNSRHELLRKLMYTTMLEDKSALKENVEANFTLDLNDIPALAREEWAPPMTAFNMHVYFYYTYATSSDEFWQKEGSVWRGSVEKFIKPNESLRESVNSLVGAQDTEVQKAEKLYAEVMKLENTDYTRHKTEAELKLAKEREPRNAEDVWKQRSGTSDELALLYVAMVNSAGMKAWPMWITDRSRNIFDRYFMSLSQLEDVIAVINVNGKDVYLDPGDKFCDFGELGWKHLFSGGLRVTEDYKGAFLAGTPLLNNYAKAAVQRLAGITLDENGNVTGDANYIMTGPEALRWRHLNLTAGSDEVKKQFNKMLRRELPDGIRGELDHFIGMDEDGVKLFAEVKLSGNMGTMTGKRLILPGLFFVSHEPHPFISDAKRLTPVDMHYADMTQDSVNYHLPAGFTVESSPGGDDVIWSNNAEVRIKSSMKDGVLNVGRLYARNFFLLKSTEYQQLHDFYMKMAAADQQQIVLTRASTTNKGN